MKEMSVGLIGVRMRVVRAIASVIPALVGVPFVLQTWAPRWFVFGWVSAYGMGMIAAIVFVFPRPNQLLERVWSAYTGLAFGALPLSTVWFEGEQASAMVAITISVVHVAFEIGSAPASDLQDWLLASAVGATCAGITGFFFVPFVPAAMFMFILVFTLVNANGMRMVKQELEDLYAIAQVEGERAQFHAEHDEMTGLLDRRGFAGIWTRYVDGPCTVAMFDVNSFKRVNDTWGYVVGDEVLRRAALELRDRLPDGWELGRHGGDEFVAITAGHQQIPETLQNTMNCQVFRHGSVQELDFTFSVGFAHSSGSKSLDRLLTEVGYALRAAKREEVGLQYFGGELAERFERTVEVGASANESMVAHAVEPVAQLFVSDIDGAIGCEMLARWKRPDGSQMMPAAFLPLLAENGLMPVLNDVMLENAVIFAARFNNRPVAPFVAVNITASHLATPGLVDRVKDLLDKHRVDSSRLMIEITENESLSAVLSWEATARELEEIGLKLAIDDFGSGYSSIERLNQLPITHLKFDRSLNKSVTGPLGDVVRGVVQFARASGIGVIAEGIETFDELEAMRAIGVNTFQGYYFDRPQSLDIVERAFFDQIPMFEVDPLGPSVSGR